MSVKDYLRERYMPHLWCAGCGHGIVMNNLIRAIIDLGLSKNDIVMVTGIGCSSRISGYLDFHTLHTLHGRALAFATGVKLARPELSIIVPMGDGDAVAIGGNHFIHAARRNIDVTSIIMNNSIYGMTGGQFSPLTGHDKKATTAPFGSIDHPFDTVRLAMGAGASFVARTTTYHVTSMKNILKKAIMHKGFSVVEILSQCPTYFGTKNKMGNAVDMLNNYKTHTVPIGSKKKKENPDLIERGIFVQEEREEYCAEYEMLVKKVKKE
ncbi:MAG: 2-oxoacid:ferredoxin oxidoreductase subunit beta [Desulfobacteraceae bacterium 4484_190.1]|nr:MAG: 2-oxoacid:ferredoxin oxidoreductase subunit beta [Desulfobacteraceae bacterium 4484_190.1]